MSAVIDEFVSFKKIARLSREIIITEKIDGTNAQIFITQDGRFLVGSRSKWITPDNDNHGFARWAYENEKELRRLGPGNHFGEWWGMGIQRGYGLNEKRFSLFNTARWNDSSIRPDCCYVVPVLETCLFNNIAVNDALSSLKESGSVAAPGFGKPEGVVVFHTASNIMFKKTIEKDEEYKGRK